jgi:dUTP pyrophosphatase
MVFIKAKLLEPYSNDVKLLEYYAETSIASEKPEWNNSGIDLVIPYAVDLKAGESTILKTFLACELMIDDITPASFGYMVCLRSSLAAKKGLIIMNGVGVIDPNYRGGIGLIVYATKNVKIDAYERVGQIVLPSMEPFSLRLVRDLSTTERGEGGFGSTGTSGLVKH